MKYIVRTKDENLHLVDYWVIDETEVLNRITSDHLNEIMLPIIDSKEEDAWLLFIKITRKGQYVVYSTSYLDPTKYGMRYRRYWFCEMEHFFRFHKDDIELKWKKDYGRQTEEN